MRFGRGILVFVLLLSALGILWFLEKFGFTENTFLLSAIKNAGHAPLFGILSLVMFGLSTHLLGRCVPRRDLHYLIAFVSTCMIGAFSEFIQISGPRDADIMDIIRDVIGAVSFLAILMTFDSGTVSTLKRIGGKTISLIRLIAILLFLTAFIDVMLLGVASLHRYHVFPQICGFETYWENRFLETETADLTITAPPPRWNDAGGAHVGKLTFPRADFPHIFIEPYPDWSDYEFLNVKIYSEEDTSLALTLRIDDSQPNSAFEDRFRRQIIINPGMNEIHIPLNMVQNAPPARKMDMTSIHLIYLIAIRPRAPFVIYIDDFRLS